MFLSRSPCQIFYIIFHNLSQWATQWTYIGSASFPQILCCREGSVNEADKAQSKSQENRGKWPFYKVEDDLLIFSNNVTKRK